MVSLEERQLITTIASVYPESLVLARLRKDTIRESAYGLTRLVLLSAWGGGPGSDDKGDDGSSFWCYCETSEEISLITSEVRVPLYHLCSHCRDTNRLVCRSDSSATSLTKPSSCLPIDGGRFAWVAVSTALTRQASSPPCQASTRTPRY